MLRRMMHSLTFRLAVMFSAAALLVLLLLGVAVLYVVNQHFISQDRMMLSAQSKHLIHRLHNVTELNQLPSTLNHVANDAAHNEHGFSVLIVDDHNQPVYQDNHHPITTPAMIEEALSQPLSSRYGPQNSYRMLTQPIDLLGKPATLIVALNINHHETFLASFRYSIWFSIAIAALLMGLLACLVAKKGLSPLHTLMQQTEQITVNNLDQRIPVSQSYAEIAQLTATYNAMLDRLHHSFQRLIGFSSDLAHELRTPLSTLKMQNQVMLSRPRSVAEYQKAMQDNAEALDQLTRMVTNLLFLAKSDHGLIQPEPAPFALHDEINQLFEFYDYLAQDKSMTLQLTGQAMLCGDKNLLRRAISNLIANAINYGEAGTVIALEISEHTDHVLLTVKNTGDTIDEMHLPHLFERFYRADRVRSHGKEGVGLGLAITASIIAAHQGTITVSSIHRLTSFSLTLPKHKA